MVAPPLAALARLSACGSADHLPAGVSPRPSSSWSVGTCAALSSAVTFRDFRGFRGRRQTRRSAARRKPRCPSPTGFRRSATPAPGLNGLARAHICTGTGRPPCPHLRQDWACRLSIGTGVGLTPATSAPGLGSPLPHPSSPSAQVTRDVLSGARWMDVTAANVRSVLPVRPRRRRGPGCHCRSPPLGTHQHGQVAKCARGCCRRWW